MNHTNNIWKEFVYNGRHYQVEHKDPFLNSGRCRVVVHDMDGSIHISYVWWSDCTPEKLEEHFHKLIKERYITK